jgi:sugar O-acyltransferase (sialic acid O-acetyltransferase NeuD family)
MERIVVISGGGQAKVIMSILKKNGEFEVAGYVDRVDKGTILGVRYLGGDDVLQELFDAGGVRNAVIGYGQLKDVSVKKEIVQRVAKIGFSFPPVVSRCAVVNEDVVVSKGSVIIDGVVVNSGSRIGEFCLINTKSSVGHDCIIGDFTHVAPGSTLTGEVKLGKNVLIGAGATVIQCRSIGDNVIIGAGSVVVDDISEPGTYVGVPARKIDS